MDIASLVPSLLEPLPGWPENSVPTLCPSAWEGKLIVFMGRISHRYSLPGTLEAVGQAMEKFRLWLFTLASLLLLCNSAVAQSKCSEVGRWVTSETATVVTGEYCNVEYGYLVRLGNDLRVYVSTPPAPNHGFGVNLRPGAPDKPDIDSIPYLWVDASYDALDARGLRKAAASQIQLSCRPDSRPVVRIRKRVELDGVPAEYVQLTCSGQDSVQEFVVSYRKQRDIIYTIQLITTPSRLQQDHTAFQQIVSNFHFTELPQP